jgi:hypothetical protein
MNDNEITCTNITLDDLTFETGKTLGQEWIFNNPAYKYENSITIRTLQGKTLILVNVEQYETHSKGKVIGGGLRYNPINSTDLPILEAQS